MEPYCPPARNARNPAVTSMRYSNHPCKRPQMKKEFISLKFLRECLSKFSGTGKINMRERGNISLEKYLFAADDGWILRKARYYRGAYQIEDEEAWGVDFLKWLLRKDSSVQEQFFLIREMAKVIPHRIQNNHLIQIRTLSMEIAGLDSRFMEIRIKIHGQPEASDLDWVKAYRKQLVSPDSALIQKLKQLETEMTLFYEEETLESLRSYLPRLSGKSQTGVRLKALLDSSGTAQPSDLCKSMSELLWIARLSLLRNIPASEKLALLDLSIDLEQILFRYASEWNPTILSDLWDKTYWLAKASAACGFMEIWEWETLAPSLKLPRSQSSLAFQIFFDQVFAFKRAVEWSAGMVYGVMKPAMEQYKFEPLASGFTDYCLRSSIVLPLGECAGILSDIAAVQSGAKSKLMNLRETAGARGLNPGYGTGPLLVYPGLPDNIRFQSQNIYAIESAPANLNPIAGILTVSEGNPVSHVQLLARNLGIPNAVISNSQLQALQPFHGMPVFYAVSPQGTVLLKPASQMTDEEKQLVEVQSRSDERIRISVKKLRLKQTEPIPLRDVRTSDSGQLCGPKAANLGQLKSLFPENVVDGIVIPFGVFDKHLSQPIPGKTVTYWQMLDAIFQTAEQDRQNGAPEEKIEKQLLERLKVFRGLLKNITLSPDLIANLSRQFKTVFGKEMGEVPVFIRSDTNMEDLKDFTGAGLNLTVFNVLEKEKILQGIRDVWVSPFTERSYRWRQKYLLNPGSVFPSILIMPSVNVDKSGVMITSGLASGASDDINISFNRGVAGSVEGQMSEQYRLQSNGEDLLLSPAREVLMTTLPVTGGTEKRVTAFNTRILSEQERMVLRQTAERIKQRMADIPGDAYDVELGFLGDKLYLFQVRPYVENKKAKSSVYLQHLDSALPRSRTIRTDVPYSTFLK